MAALFSLTLPLLLIYAQMYYYSVKGSRPSVELSEVAEDFIGNREGEEESMEMVMVEAMIGSRPPNCVGRCSSCGGHCEAVQVPLVPEKKGKSDAAKEISASINSRSDEYSSNYKPMNWKCKCGGIILNP